MIVKSECTCAEFVNDVTSGKKQIICYGAGMVALSIEDIFQEFGIAERVCCFIDIDSSKHGSSIEIASKSVRVYGINDLLKFDLTDKTLLITCEAFGSVITALNDYQELDDLPCYIFPAINRSYAAEIISSDRFCNEGYKDINEKPLIPKTIHYCWFGNEEFSDLMKKCLLSWKKYNPDYQITCWNEDTYDVYQNSYMKQAYQSGNFAFVSDYARLDILYQHGGLYFDTDVEVLKNLDSLLHNRAFIAYGEWAMVNSASSGSMPGLEIIRQMRDTPRGKIGFLNTDGSFNRTTNSVYETDALCKLGFIKNFTYQVIGGVAIYPPCFFSSDGILGITTVDERTYTVHHCSGSWSDDKEKMKCGVNCK